MKKRKQPSRSKSSKRDGAGSAKAEPTKKEHLEIIKRTRDLIRITDPAVLASNLRAIQLDILAKFDALMMLIGHCELGALVCNDEEDKGKANKCLDICDTWLIEIISRIVYQAIARAKVTKDTGLVGVATQYCPLEELPDLLKRIPESEWDDPATSDCMGFTLLEGLASVIRFIEHDAVQHPERYRLWAREQPFFPLLAFRNKSAYDFRFRQISDAVQLGAVCPINTTSNAQFRWDIPLNVLVFETLLEFMRVIDYLHWGDEKKPRDARTPELILTRYAQVSMPQVPIFLEANPLWPPKKGDADEWTGLIVRYLQTEHSDLKQVPELADHIGKTGGFARARWRIKAAFRSLARP